MRRTNWLCPFFAQFILLLMSTGNVHGEDPLFEKLLEAQSSFRKDLFGKGSVKFRFEEYIGTQLAHCREVTIKNDLHIVRSLGKDLNSVLDDRLYILGPNYAFSLTFTGGKNEEGKPTYNLVGISPADAKLDPETTFFEGIVGVQEVFLTFPWRFDILGLKDLVGGYESVSFLQPNPDVITLKVSKPKDTARLKSRYMFIDQEIELDFHRSNQWRLAEVRHTRENYGGDGKLREEFKNRRTYFNSVNEFGHGVFKNGEFIEGTDFVDGVTAMNHGRRLRWETVEVADDEFTPEFYGIDPSVGVANSGPNWLMWGVLIASLCMIGLGVWLKYQSPKKSEA